MTEEPKREVILVDQSNRRASFSEVKTGDRFKIIEVDGILLEEGKIFIATKDAYLQIWDDDGSIQNIWTIESNE